MGVEPYEPVSGDSLWLEDVPKHWRSTSIKNCFDTRLGKMLQPKPVQDSDEVTPYLKALHVNWRGVSTDALPVMFASADERSKYAVQNNDLLVCEGGEVGRAAILRGLQEPAIIQNALHRVRSTTIGNNEYLNYLLKHIADAGWFDILCNKATIAHLTSEKLGAIKIPLPPYTEQAQIARFLDYKTAQLDQLIAKKQALIERLNEQRIALITQAVTRGLDPDVPLRDSGVEWLGQVPERWEVVRFKDHCSIVGGQVDPTKDTYRDMTLIAPDHIEKDSGRIIKLESATDQGAISGKYYYESGCVLYSKIRPELNKVCIADFSGLCSADMYAITTDKDLDYRFLFYVMLSKYFYQFAVLESMRVAMPKVNRESLSVLPMVIPPVAEQREIIDFLTRATSKIDQLKQVASDTITRLEEYRTALITAAVTGKIDVRDIQIPVPPNDGPTLENIHEKASSQA